MTVAFVTKIRSMERYLEDGFVYSVQWELTADSGTCQVNRIGQVGFERVEGVAITAFELLTESTVTAWVDAHVDKDYLDTLKLSMTQQLTQLMTPPTTAVGMPWLMIRPNDLPDAAPHDLTPAAE